MSMKLKFCAPRRWQEGACGRDEAGAHQAGPPKRVDNAPHGVCSAVTALGAFNLKSQFHLHHGYLEEPEDAGKSEAWCGSPFIWFCSDPPKRILTRYHEMEIKDGAKTPTEEDPRPVRRNPATDSSFWRGPPWLLGTQGTINK